MQSLDFLAVHTFFVLRPDVVDYLYFGLLSQDGCDVNKGWRQDDV